MAAPGSAGDGDVRACHKHVRANDIATLDGVTKGNVPESAICAYVARRSKSGFKHCAGIRDGLQRNSRSRLLELIHGFRVVRTIGKMSMAIDETGKHGHFAEVDNYGIRRNCHIVANGFDLAIANDNGLAGKNGARIGIDQFAGVDGGDLRIGVRNQTAQAENEKTIQDNGSNRYISLDH